MMSWPLMLPQDACLVQTPIGWHVLQASQMALIVLLVC